MAMPGTMETEGITPTIRTAPGRERRIARLGNLMMVIFDFYDGPMIVPDKPHTHPHEQITYVASGEVLFIKGMDEYHLHEGDMMTIPPEIPHSVQTLSEHVRLVDCFTPPREDLLIE